ncbi:hypothetical protein SAMN02745146_3234 [Hymenobacter daecheongensis DSM 21074]|uniref:DUF3108 domain-containing protein n=1 Tax=Hymenobacter daecheongensis DSM 21074 TaxID=1121955 RepID=A0A1M6JR13_9BACT|nr:hypothetical protein [Hymenobacter daecheongensis]SHJ49127.1 hypothetical protein SAMN02745146_3234 [Hymenobacter daecheongensis DSM 21074]
MKLSVLLSVLALTAAHAQTTPPPTAPTPDTAAARSAAAPPQTAGAACAHPFGLHDDMELVYRLASGEGKPTGELRYRVVRLGSELNKKKTRATTTVLLKSGLYDAKSRLLSQQDLTFRCSRDTTFTDGLTQFNPETLKSFRDRIFDFSPLSIAWPNQPTIGSRLPDGGTQVQVRSSAVDIAKVSTLLRKRRVVSGPAAVKTPAGTFQCYKVESERETMTRARTDVAFRTTVRVVDYYAPSVGVVKTEIYGKNGKLAETRTLAVLSGRK